MGGSAGFVRLLVQGGGGDGAELVGVDDDVDGADGAGVDLEADDAEGAAGDGDDEARPAVDRGEADGRRRRRLLDQVEQEVGGLVAADDRLAGGGDAAAAVRPDGDVVGEGGEQGRQVAVAAGAEEALGQAPLVGRVGGEAGAAGGEVGAGAAGELAAVGGALGDDGGDLGVLVGEDVVEEEDGALLGGEGLEEEEEGGREGVGEGGLVGGVGVGRGGGGGGDEGLGQPGADVGFALDAGGPELVEAKAGDDGREPGPGGGDRLAGGEGAVPAEGGLLDGVLGVGDGAEHPVGDGEEEGAVPRGSVGVAHGVSGRGRAADGGGSVGKGLTGHRLRPRLGRRRGGPGPGRTPGPRSRAGR